MFRLYFLILFIVSPLFVQSQENCLQLFHEKTIYSPTREHFICLKKLSWDLKKVDNKQAEQYATKGILPAESIKDSLSLDQFTSHLTLIKAYQGEPQKTLNLTNRSMTFFKRLMQILI